MISRLVRQIRNFLRNEHGPTAVEYAVMIALIVVVCIGTITTLGSNSNKTFTTTAKAAGKGG
ncbi:MAG TPA: Flp family type IVb pilin [Gemmataceae bacterium]|jgi:pilus assembly protein Flp/PilA|nr:Flp family type IVb pilin [Gemmataceae bacterium]